MMNHRFQIFTGLCIIITVVLLTLFAIKGPLSTYTQAAHQVASKSTSFILAYPLQARVGETIKVDVFLTTDDGVPVRNQSVTLITAQKSLPLTATSDSHGQASFVLKSTLGGPDVLTYTVQGARHPSTTTVTIDE